MATPLLNVRRVDVGPPLNAHRAHLLVWDDRTAVVRNKRSEILGVLTDATVEELVPQSRWVVRGAGAGGERVEWQVDRGCGCGG
jgi:hypothetical protein